MLFTQIEFFIFLTAVILFLLFVKNHVFQKRFLLIASCYFYAYWDWRCLGLVFFVAIVNYFAARLIVSSNSQMRRKAFLATSTITCLGVLGFFKYYNFFILSLAVPLHSLGLRVDTLEILLPIGISFFTFQTLSYTIDIYRGSLKPCQNFWDFSLFITFFPQLVAGPIVRASEFLPQLETPRIMNWNRAFRGVQQFSYGLFKKVFIADRLAFFVDYSFDNAGLFDAATTWLSVIAYAIQIYCDFSGYSDMAIGLARVMGFDFSKNFDYPYLSCSITEFWRRWHISLSSFLRDYLYIPLGGNRKGNARTYVNLMVTMTFGGLWHGASWTFVVWGALHGTALIAEKWLSQNLPKVFFDVPVMIRNSLGRIITLFLVLIAWVFFRSSSFDHALLMLRQMFGGSIHGITWFYPFVFFGLLFIIATHVIQMTRWNQWIRPAANHILSPIIIFTIIWLVIIFYPKNFAPFIYFQF